MVATNKHRDIHIHTHREMRMQAKPETINFKGLDINRGTKVTQKVCVTHTRRKKPEKGRMKNE